MPSNEQLIINLRTLLASDILHPDNEGLSESGRMLVLVSKKWLQQFIDLLQNKNSGDQIQDFIWFLSKSKISVDLDDLASRASKARARADTVAAYKSLQTVGSLLLTNSDFRLFLSDLSTIGREVFRDTAFTLSDVAKDAGKRLEPPKEEQEALKRPGGDEGPAPSEQDLEAEVAEVSMTVGNGVARVAKEAEHSLVDKLTGEEKETLLYRLQQAVLKLRRRGDYSGSVSTISLLIKRYALVYSRAIQETADAAEEDIHENSATDRAMRNFWTFLVSFGDAAQWKELERRFKDVLAHGKDDPQFESFAVDVGNSLQAMLTDPSFFDHADAKFKELREKSRRFGTNSSLRDDVDGLLAQLHSTVQSVLHDQDVANLLQTSTKAVKILSPAHQLTNDDVITDSIHVFIPRLVQAVQYVPIPRLEVSTPEVDLLLENLILEPGRTVNQSSFLPYKLRVETHNDLEIRKARFGTSSKVSSMVSIKLDGLSIRADEIGYWVRVHSGLIRLTDEGIASFHLDERGIDIHMDVEVGKDRLEKMLTLKAVRVHIHKLNYTLRRSKFSFFAWLFKPFVRPIIRKVMERQIAHAVADFLHAANRELLFARERLRATRISEPADLATFFKAVTARIMPEPDPDLYARVGIAQPGKGVFKGVYAPGSIVKLWNEEAANAAEQIEEYEEGGWRNGIFDVHTTAYPT